MLNLQRDLEHLTPGASVSPWRDHEHVRGYGVFGLPLASGYTLALRVFWISDFGSYTTVWCQDRPARGRSIITRRGRMLPVRGTTARGRAYRARGDRSSVAQRCRIVDLYRPAATGMDVRMHAPPILRLLNGVSRRLPLWIWQHERLLKPREWIARELKMGTLNLAGTMPSGHDGILMPQQVYFINHAHVTLDGRDLGNPVRVPRTRTLVGLRSRHVGSLRSGKPIGGSATPRNIDAREQRLVCSSEATGPSGRPRREETAFRWPVRRPAAWAGCCAAC